MKLLNKNNLKDINDLQAMGFGSRSTIWRRVGRGELPQPIRFGTAHNSKWFWLMEDIEKVLNKIFGKSEDDNHEGVLDEYKI